MRDVAAYVIIIASLSFIALSLLPIADTEGHTSISNNDNHILSEEYNLELYRNNNTVYDSSAFNEALLAYTVSSSVRTVNNTMKGMCDEEQVILRIESDSIQQSLLSIKMSFITLDSNGETIDNSTDTPDVVSISLHYGTDYQESLEPSSGNGITSPFIINDLQSGINYMVMMCVGYSSTRTLTNAYSFNTTISFDARPSSDAYEGNLISSVQSTSNLIQLVESANSFNGVTITGGDGNHSILEMESDDSVLENINWSGDAGVIAENGNSNNAFTSSRNFTTVEFDTTNDSSFYIYIYMASDGKCTFILEIDNPIAKTQTGGLTITKSGYIGIRNNQVVFSTTLNTKELDPFSGITDVTIKGKNNTGASNNHYARLYILFSTDQTNTSSLSSISETYITDSNYSTNSKSSESSINDLNPTVKDLTLYSIQTLISNETCPFSNNFNAESYTNTLLITTPAICSIDQSSESTLYEEPIIFINAIVAKEPVESNPSNDGM